MANKQPARQPRAQQPQSQAFGTLPNTAKRDPAPTGEDVTERVASGLAEGDADEAGAAAPGGLTLEPYQVLIKPLVTEKNVHKSEKLNQYAFEVHPQATKTDIRGAVEKLFDVRVVSVRTQNRLGKPRRTRFKKSRTKPWKRAIVTLHEDSRINFF